MNAVADIIAFTPYDRITLDTVDYDFVKVTSEGYTLRKSETDLFASFTFQQMSEFERSPLYRLSRDHYRLGALNARERSGVDEFAMIPQWEHPKIIWKYEICTRVYALVKSGRASMSNEGLKEALALIKPEILALDCAIIPPRGAKKSKRSKKNAKPKKVYGGSSDERRIMVSYRSVQRWIAILEDCDWDIQALREGRYRSGNRFEQHPAEIEELLHEHARAFASQARPTVEHQFGLLEQAVNKLNKARVAAGKKAFAKPSKRRFKKEIDELGAFFVYARRHSLIAAQRKFAGQDQGFQATRIGERIEIDGWHVSLQTLLIKARVWKQLDDETRKKVGNARPWLILALDRASRVVLAMRLVEQINSAEAIATNRVETRALIVTGKTGAGKSSLLSRVFTNHPSFAGYGVPGSGCPAITVGTPSPCTQKALGLEILNALGYPISANKTQAYVYAMVRERLQRLGIVVLHLDEVHNLLESASDRDIREIRKLLKNFMTSDTWPVVLVLSGLPEIVPFFEGRAERDEDGRLRPDTKGEVRRRSLFVHLRSLSLPGDVAMVCAAFQDIVSVTGLHLPPNLKTEIVPRAIHAAMYELGTTLQLAQEAISFAIAAGAQELGIQHFARAYRVRAGCADVMNPFVAARWQTLDCSLVLKKNQDEAEAASQAFELKNEKNAR